jgi:hypothetical protein
MEESAHEMVLVYDAKRQAWQTSFSEGRIIRLYYLPYEGEHMFEIDEGHRLSSWPRPEDSQWFVIGSRARIEHTVGEPPQVLRIWIGGPA